MFGLKHALRGLKHLITSERNFRIQFILFLLTICAGLLFGISLLEWVTILITSMIVLSLEAINTSIERLCDLYTKNHHDTIKFIKDVSAAAVLIAAIVAVVIGFIIFAPKILMYLT